MEFSISGYVQNKTHAYLHSDKDLSCLIYEGLTPSLAILCLIALVTDGKIVMRASGRNGWGLSTNMAI